MIFRIAETLAKLLAPVLSFTAEEVWGHLPGPREDSVHLPLFPADLPDAPEVDEKAVKRLLGLRDVVLVALEDLRQNGTIGKSEEASVVCVGDSSSLQADLEASGIDLERFLIVSAVEFAETGNGAIEVPAYPGLNLMVASFEAPICSRCWRRFDALVDDPELPDLCPRCHDVVGRLLAAGLAELERADD